MTHTSGISSVLVAGAGTMGQEIAFCCAEGGFHVRIYDTNPQALVNAAESKQILSDVLAQDPVMAARRQHWLRTFTVQTDLDLAANGVDLVIECIPERLGLKRDFFRRISQLCPSPAILVTNSSMLVPSQMTAVVESPERFAALHFMDAPAVELMGHDGTSPEVIERLEIFARQINLLPITLRRETPGHLLNAMLTSFNHAAICLAANGLAHIEDVDRVWMMCMKTRIGPFGILDTVGLDTALEITRLSASLSKDPQLKRNVDFLSQYVRDGRLGVKSRRGFYEYPNPAFSRPEFLRVDPLPGP